MAAMLLEKGIRSRIAEGTLVKRYHTWLIIGSAYLDITADQFNGLINRPQHHFGQVEFPARKRFYELQSSGLYQKEFVDFKMMRNVRKVVPNHVLKEA